MADPERTYHVNGELCPASEATVSVRDRGFMYGDAIFETLRAYGGDIFRWDEHAERLHNSAARLELEHGLSSATLRDRIDETLTANSLDDAYVKCSITRGAQPGKLTPDPVTDPTVVIQVASLPRGGISGTQPWEGPATLQTVKTRRIPDTAIPSNAKTHNYLNGILARLELRPTDADEAIMRDQEGNLAEGSTGNLFFVRDDSLCTPSLSGPVLPGITRSVVLELAAAEGIPTQVDAFDIDDLHRASEAFVTNSTWEIRPVDTADGIAIGSGPVTALLRRLFSKLVEEECYR